MDDEYVEGDSGSAAADAPGTIPTDDAPERAAVPKGGGFDSASTHDAPVIRRSTKQSHTVEARKAFAAAILENKAKPPTGAASEAADLDPEAAPSAPIAASADVAAAKAKGADAPKPPPAAADILAATPPPAAPPAPSLDPEVRRLKEQLAAERKALEAERAELEKAKAKPAEPTAPVALGLEDYIEAAPRAFRSWLESMRGEPLTDDEYKAEVSDFITQSSAEVLGVPLPEATRIRLEAALARKAVKTNRTIQAKREAARTAAEEKARAEAAERQATEELERQWSQAAHAVGTQFQPTADATGKPTASQAAAAYPWLAAEDEPGKIVVDVIRAAAQRDGTQLSWQEAAKKANDFLADQAKSYYEKRKPLLGEKPAAPPAAKPMAAVTPAPAQPPAAPPAEPRPAANPSKWTRDRHLESTKAAFRKALSGG